ncbi:uncharacterized protein LOC6549464 [Drosophila erecta]|uniref:Uncharacterized protein n=1 Tax=Drosophila erecta TaxID=7220 RepID=B3NRL9_DROER|nr:uncharacterized protein LOC6549464 [Drosophila erecta]EDV56171.2 uncharacterized protein Dere_GG22498 [Drosophila erecta]
MYVPLLHRSTQMVLLKRQIRRKAKELRLRKRHAHHRLQVMRRIRDHLLSRMRNSIDHRQRDAEQRRREQARRAVGGMLSMYKHWLRNWSTALRLQSRLIRQQEQVKVGLRRRLRHLRKQLKKVRHPQTLVDKCFNRLFKAVRKWQKRSDYYELIKDQDKVWEAEAQEVRNYLSDVRGRRPRKTKRRRVKQNSEIEDFAHFWNTEVVQKNALIKKQMAMVGRKPDLEMDATREKTRKPKRKKRKIMPKKIYFSLDDLVVRRKVKKIRKAIRRPRKPDPLKPSFDELKMLVQELIRFNWKKKVLKHPKMSRKAIGKEHKVIFGKMPSLSDLPTLKPQIRIKKIWKRSRKVGPKNVDMPQEQLTVPDPKIPQSKSRKHRRRKMHYVDRIIKGELNAILEAKARKKATHAAKTSAAKTKQKESKELENQENLVSLLYSDLPPFMRREIERKNQNKLRSKLVKTSSSSSTASKEVFIESEKVNKMEKPKIVSKLPSSGSASEIKNRYELPAENSLSQVFFKRESVVSLSDSINKFVMATRNRKFTRRSIRMPPIIPKKIRVAPPKGQNESHYQSLKKDIMYIHTSHEDLGALRMSNRQANRSTASESALHSHTSAHRSPKSPSKSKFNYDVLPNDLDKILEPVRDGYDRTEKSPQEFHYAKAVESDVERFHLTDLHSDAKYRHLQSSLKDVIEKNKIIEYIADVNGLMQDVANHDMWSNLQSLYNELEESGLTLEERKEMLALKYLEYLNDVVTQKSYTRLEPPRDNLLRVVDSEFLKGKQKSQVDRLMERNWWTRHRNSTRVIPFGMRGLRGSRSNTSHSRRQSQEMRMDSVLHRKLLEQELKAERLEREERRRRTLSSFLGSTFSLNPSLDLAPNDEQDVRDIEWRYSLNNIKGMMNHHLQMFQALARKTRAEQLIHKDMEGKMGELYSSTQFRRHKPESTTLTLRKKRRNLRPIEELYYSPRKTCRLQKISGSSDCLACECQEQEIGASMVLEKCPRCGVKVPVPAPTTPFPMSSSSSCEILSSGSIEACAKNRLLINTLEDLCTRCGYFHQKGHLCAHSPLNMRKTELLKRIRNTVRTAPECSTICCPRGILKEPSSFDPWQEDKECKERTAG